MSILNFPPTDPSDPDYSEFHQQNGYTWEWDGIAWRVSGRPQLVLPPGTTVGPDAPTQPENGQAWFDTKVYDLFMWVVNPDTGVTGWSPVMRYTQHSGADEPLDKKVGDIWDDPSTGRTQVYREPEGWIEINQRLAVQSTSPGETYPDATMFYDPNTGEFGIPQANLTELEDLRSEVNAIKAHLGIVRVSSVTHTYNVTVADKTAAHPYDGQGSTKGYYLEFLGTTEESPTLNAVVGDTLVFDQSDASNENHPIYFYTTADKGTMATGYIVSMTHKISFTPTSAGTYYYMCQNHGYMGGSIVVTD